MVDSLNAIPPEARENMVLARPGTRAEMLAAEDHALVFDGSVNIDVGALRGRDEMKTFLAVQDSRVKEVDIVYDANGPRGPPPAPRPLVVYVVGKVKRYQGPELMESSAHSARVLDLSGKQDEVYQRELVAWHRAVSDKTGISRDELAGVRDDVQIQRIVRERSGAPRPGEPGREMRPREMAVPHGVR